jgi:hypothetical protein
LNARHHHERCVGMRLGSLPIARSTFAVMSQSQSKLDGPREIPRDGNQGRKVFLRKRPHVVAVVSRTAMIINPVVQSPASRAIIIFDKGIA